MFSVDFDDMMSVESGDRQDTASAYIGHFPFQRVPSNFSFARRYIAVLFQMAVVRSDMVATVAILSIRSIIHEKEAKLYCSVENG